MSLFKSFGVFADGFGAILMLLTTAIIGGGTALIGV